jgi:hypothetical protein
MKFFQTLEMCLSGAFVMIGSSLQIWSPSARLDLHDLIEYISEDSPQIAKRFIASVFGMLPEEFPAFTDFWIGAKIRRAFSRHWKAEPLFFPNLGTNCVGAYGFFPNIGKIRVYSRSFSVTVSRLWKYNPELYV